jgi:hypothetical protein
MGAERQQHERPFQWANLIHEQWLLGNHYQARFFPDLYIY